MKASTKSFWLSNIMAVSLFVLAYMVFGWDAMAAFAEKWRVTKLIFYGMLLAFIVASLAWFKNR